MPRMRDVAFVVFLVGYLIGGLFVLVQGLVAVVAAASPELQQTWRIQGLLGDGALDWILLRASSAAPLLPAWPQIALDYLISLVNLVLAGVLLWLRPRDWTARLLAVALVGAAGVLNLTAQVTLERLPLSALEAGAQAGAHVVAGLAYVYALLLFPDGRPVPQWSRPRIVLLYAPITLAAMVVSAGIEGANRPVVLITFFGLLVPALGACAQVYRIRYGSDVRVQAQARLLLWTLLLSVGLGLVFIAVSGFPNVIALPGRHVPDPQTGLYRVFQPVFTLIPVALFVGLVRFKLWDIERVFNRTLVYAAVTGSLGLVYVGFVVFAENTLGTVAASPLINSRPAVAITTLALAAGFRPLRGRVQRFVDRRFNRRRYDAQVTVEQFSERLRDRADLASVAAELEQIVRDVVEPQYVSVWVRGGP